MLSNLVESQPQKSRRTAGTAASFIAHYGLILFALYTSAQATTLDDGRKQEKIAFVDTPPDDPPERKEPLSPEQIAAPMPVRDLQVFVAPVDIPTVLPEIDLSRAGTDPKTFRRLPLTVDSAGAPPVSKPRGGEAYGEREVEKPVRQAPNSAAPAYPDILRQAGIEGETLVSFVVDTAGRVEIASFKVIRTSHELFATAVKSALPRMRFIPAEAGSNKVRQLVQQPYSFAIVK